jgi:hypothetical protein
MKNWFKWAKWLRKLYIFMLIGLVLSCIAVVLTVVLDLPEQAIAHTIAPIFAIFVAAMAPFSKRPNKDIKDEEGNNEPATAKAIEWLSAEERAVRKEHKLELRLSLLEAGCEQFVLVGGTHEYKLAIANAGKEAPSSIDIYTDLGAKLNKKVIPSLKNELTRLPLGIDEGQENDLTNRLRGGFEGVEVKDKHGNTIKDRNGNQLAFSRDLTTYTDTKAQFKFEIGQDSSYDALKFEYKTYGVYRLNDRLVWTVQELSENFDVTIIFESGLNRKNLKGWVNHHDRENISLRDGVDGKAKNIAFTTPVFPYQGFELSWDFDQD